MRNELLEDAAVAICELHGENLTGGARDMLCIAGENVRSALELINTGRDETAMARVRKAHTELSKNGELATASSALRKAIHALVK